MSPRAIAVHGAWPACLLALTLGCVQDPGAAHTSHAITDGTADDGDPAIVGLVAANSIYCTGTLIAPRVVLTAGHCIDEVLPQRVFFGPSIELGGSFVDVAERHPHPALDRSTLANDIGLVVLSQPAPDGTAPIPLGILPLDDSFVGRSLRLVGYGGTGAVPAGDGRKRQGATTVDTVDDTTFRFGPDPSQTCTGDSGGPALYHDGSSEIVVGVTSTGDPGCEVYGQDTRVDAYTGDFICPLLSDLGAQAAGDCPIDDGAGCCSAGEASGGGVAAWLLVIIAVVRRRRRP